MLGAVTLRQQGGTGTGGQKGGQVTLDGTVPSKKGYLRSKAAVQITQYLPCEHVQYSTVQYILYSSLWPAHESVGQRGRRLRKQTSGSVP